MRLLRQASGADAYSLARHDAPCAHRTVRDQRPCSSRGSHGYSLRMRVALAKVTEAHRRVRHGRRIRRWFCISCPATVRGSPTGMLHTRPTYVHVAWFVHASWFVHAPAQYALTQLIDREFRAPSARPELAPEPPGHVPCWSASGQVLCWFVPASESRVAHRRFAPAARAVCTPFCGVCSSSLIASPGFALLLRAATAQAAVRGGGGFAMREVERSAELASALTAREDGDD